ncbi:MAG: YqgE/AlgH family protein [Nitrospira sp.]|nr:YqgE/AlgH family protein [Nitrospira sp.]MCP9442192.1 YqgE/AlgH family protein [Nitrospira sp.]
MRRRLIRQRIAASCLAGIVLFFPPLSESLAELDPVQVPPAKGILLVAHPSMDDPNFHHTVVILIEHGPSGTAGLVLNRPTNISLSQALPDRPALKGSNDRLFAGGPVLPNHVTMLIRTKETGPALQRIVDGLYVSGSLEMLDRLATQPKPAEAFRVFAGMAGWAPGQLAFELRQGAWATLSADLTILDDDPETLWLKSLQRLQTPRFIAR